MEKSDGGAGARVSRSTQVKRNKIRSQSSPDSTARPILKRNETKIRAASVDRRVKFNTGPFYGNRPLTEKQIMTPVINASSFGERVQLFRLASSIDRNFVGVDYERAEADKFYDFLIFFFFFYKISRISYK